jgi:hypothetical protein
MTPLLLSALLALAPAAEAPSAEVWRWAPTPVPVQEPPSPTPTATSTPADPPTEPPSPAAWFDDGHAYVSQRFLQGIHLVDQFFGDVRQVDLPSNRSWVRWRNDLKVRDDGSAAFSTSLRAELRIPSIDRRLEALRLTITGGTNDALDRLLPVDPSDPEAAERPSAGLKLFLLDTLLTQTDLSAGLLFSWPVGWYTRLRLRHNQPVGDLLLARFAVSGFWQTPTGWGTRGDVDLERRLAPRLLLRLANTATFTEVSRGWEWASELALLTVIGQRTAVFLGGGPSGATDLGSSVEIWKARLRVRRDVLRRWLFLELEPGLQWKRPVGGGRLRERYVVFRVEIQFGGEPLPNLPAPAAPPAAPPEPAASPEAAASPEPAAPPGPGG